MLAGLFVLGGDFWDKLKALFVYSAKVYDSAREGVQSESKKDRFTAQGGT